MKTVQFSIYANVEKDPVATNLVIVDGWDEEMNEIKLLMSDEQFKNAEREYLDEQAGDLDFVSGYCYFTVSDELVFNGVANCVLADEFYVDMCYDYDINADELEY